MHIETEKEKLIWYLDLVSKAATKNQTLPVLQCVRITTEKNKINITTTNLEFGIRGVCEASVTEEGDVAVPITLLLQTIQLLTHNKVTLKTKDNTLSVVSGGSHTNIKTFPIDEFPNIPTLSGEGQVINGKLFAEGVRTAVFAVSQSSVKPELGSVYIHQKKEHSLTFVATDSFRLIEKTVPQKGFSLEAPVMIPHRNATELARVLDMIDEDPELVVSENQAALRFKNGVYITTRLTEGSFPDYRQIIPKEYETHATVLVADLAHALKKTNIFANKFMQVEFVVAGAKKLLTLSSHNDEAGETKEEVGASVDGEDIRLSFNQRYVSDPLNYFAGESVVMHFAGVGRPMVIESVSEKSLLYLVMPMNK